jgi:methionyl-tRNA synthetase
MSQNFYITTSIAYANGEPHIGFAMESVQADTIARYHRQRGSDTHFLTGTDEHGVKLQKTAAEKGISPQELCDANSARFRALREVLNLSWDDFIRTTDRERHWPAVTKLWQQLVAAGKLEKRKYTGLYCAGCEEFKKETDLVEGKCPNHQKEPEKVEEENWFFRLSDYSAQILDLFESGQIQIVPEFRAKEFLNVVRDGLHDISFSRPRSSLEWGIPVPGDDGQVMYVWCDALTNYASAVDYAGEGADFQKWWQGAEITHVIGKDIVRFHAGIWIGMLLAAGVKTPEKIYVHGFVTSEGQKMSKSLGNVVDPVTIVSEWGTDAVRYYLLSEIPNGQDGDFSQQRFREKYEAELANGLGNLVSRTIAMALKIQNEKFKIQNLDLANLEVVEQMWSGVEQAFVEYDFRRALAAIFMLVEWANKFVDTEKPWELKDDPKKQQEILGTLLEAIRQIALALQPFLPETADKIAKSLGVHLDGDFAQLKEWGAMKEFRLTKPGILFPKKD